VDDLLKGLNRREGMEYLLAICRGRKGSQFESESLFSHRGAQFADKILKMPVDQMLAAEFEGFCLYTAPAHALGAATDKNEIKKTFRQELKQALGKAVGNPNITMSYSKFDDHLNGLGVAIYGWPPEIPRKDPSALNVNHMRRVAALMSRGEIKFLKLNSGTRSED